MFLFGILGSKSENIFMIHISVKAQEKACLKHLDQQSEGFISTVFLSL